MKNRLRERILSGERLESRFCLTQFGFAQHELFRPEFVNPFAASADLDGDRDLDVLVATNTGTLAWFENQIDSFVKHIITINGDGYREIMSHDIDSDGDNDIVAVARTVDRLETIWHENTDSKGSFGPAERMNTTTPFIAKHLADLDGDGDVDIASLRSWRENDGLGDFSDPLVFSENRNGSRNISAIDVDGDGDLDLVSSSSAKISWFENVDGKDRFAIEHKIEIENHGRDVRWADMDRDGDNDVVVNSVIDLVWYENLDNGLFGMHPIEHKVTSRSGIIRSFSVVDIDKDADLDVLYNSGSDLVFVENINGRGTFADEGRVLFPFHGGIIAVDLNGDEAVDLLARDSVVWYQNEGQMKFTPRPSLVPAAEIGDPTSLTSGDIDSDGDEDILFVEFSGGKLGWLENTDQNRFETKTVIRSNIFRPQSAALHDLDGDNDLDVLFASHRPCKISWFENTDGLGTFGDMKTVSNDCGANRVTASDLDGDGDLDVLASKDPHSRSSIAWYENLNGSGVFGSANEISSDLIGAHFILAVDIDNDGDPDVFSLSFADSKVAWYENDGRGKFGKQLVITTDVMFPNWAAVGDLDDDGDLDLVTTSFNDQKLAWYENIDGKGLFAEQRIIGKTNGAKFVMAIDLDRDDDVDLLIGSHGKVGDEFDDPQVRWYENLSNDGTFAIHAIKYPDRFSAAPNTMVAADFDKDGDIDIVSDNSWNHSITFYENRLIGDVNNDGRFNSADLVAVFVGGQYEDNIDNNSNWEDGDWNGDQDFDTSDLVLAFQAGHYSAAAQPTLNGFASAVDWLLAQDDDAKKARTR